MSTAGVKRPGVVTLIGVVLYIQAFLAAVAGIVGLAFRDRIDALVEAPVYTSNNVTWSSIWELILAVVLFFVASGIMRGSRGWRMLVAIVEGVRIVSSLTLMLYFHSGAYVEAGLISIAISLFVLWALFNERAEEYFESS